MMVHVTNVVHNALLSLSSCRCNIQLAIIILWFFIPFPLYLYCSSGVLYYGDEIFGQCRVDVHWELQYMEWRTPINLAV
jgi:hypothetical protein